MEEISCIIKFKPKSIGHVCAKTVLMGIFNILHATPHPRILGSTKTPLTQDCLYAVASDF